MVSPSRRWGPLASLLALSPVLIGAPLYAFLYQYTLPTPLTDLYNPATHLPQISESTVLGYSKYLSEDIGYRTVGTREHALGDKWMMDQVERLKEECDRIVHEAHGGRGLECEVWRQEGSGSHRFDMMNKRLYKTYVKLSNIVMRISNGTLEGKEHAILINSHVDSTLPSPGAADDALAVGIMLECIRVLINTPEWSPSYSIIFLFNNAEESLQDGSHLFSTQHPIASTVRAAINLEAAGTTGRDLLFQATSEQMIQAYSHVPRPFGTIIANEIFSSGIILSDTDFRQFEQYLNVTGLDMAIVGNSYLYHMRKDLVKNIQAGVAQHMGENALALLLHLSSPSSPLPSLTAGYTRPSTVFFSNLGIFISYSYHTANILHTLLFAASIILVHVIYIDPAPALKRGKGVWREQVRGVVAVISGAVGAIVGANAVALIMQRVLGRGMSWFSSELSTLGLYGPAALTGALIPQLFFGRIREQTMFTSLLLLQTFLACVIQFAGLGSAVAFFITGLPLFLSLGLNVLFMNNGEISLWTYALAQIVPLLTGTQLMTAILDVFVPLTGRIGADAPAEHIIASIAAVLGAYNFPLALPFAHRFGHRALSRSVVLLILATGVTIGVFSMKSPFDDMHQKRLFVLHYENLQTHEHNLHIAAADGAPGLDLLVNDLAEEFGVTGMPATFVTMDDNNTDWNSLYPFSAFLSPYKIDLPSDPSYVPALSPREKFVITVENDMIDDTAGTRSFTLKIYHPGIIWTVIAFNAHVLNWTLDDSPPDEFARHHIREASFYGQDTWTVDLTVKLSFSIGPLKIDYIGIGEKRMWPGKKAEKAEGGRAMALFEEFDRYMEETTDGTVDVLLLGCLGGQTVI